MKESSTEQKISPSINNVYQPGIGELENSKIIRSIWKNTFDKRIERGSFSNESPTDNGKIKLI